MGNNHGSVAEIAGEDAEIDKSLMKLYFRIDASIIIGTGRFLFF